MSTDRIKVLYVDDEEGNLMAFRAGYRRDFEVYTASNVKDGLALLATTPVHMVISDQRMPGISGTEFLTEVRKRWPKCIRIMLTGYSDIDAVIDAVNKGGIHAYITKPWEPLDLKLRMEQAYEVHALREERERLFNHYRQIFDASGDPIVIVDETGAFHDANPAALAFLGITRDELNDLNIATFSESPYTLATALQGRRQGRSFTNVDLALRTRRGDVVDCLVTANFQGRSPRGKALFQAMVKDITHRKKEEERLKKLNTELDQRVAVRTKQLREAMDDLSAFSYSVAHDLRSPLKSMKALSSHLCSLSDIKGDEEMSEISGRVRLNAQRMTDLVDDLLRFAQADNDAIERASVDIGELVQDCFKELDVTDRVVRLESPAPGAVIIPSDLGMLRVVFTNVLSNALKFTRTRSVAEISVKHSVVDGSHELIISDNGVGFDASKAGQLFGVFKRLHGPDKFEGTGIGLAIVQRVMRKHGGSCWADGAIDQGARIFLRFPTSNAESTMRLAS